MLTIQINGPDKSGKGYAIAYISRKLKEVGCDVTIQSEETHNASKISKTDDELIARLKDVKIKLIEMQTFN